MTHKSAKPWFTWPFMQLFSNRILHTILHCARCFSRQTSPFQKSSFLSKNHRENTAIEFNFWSQNYQKSNSFLISTQIRSVMPLKSKSKNEIKLVIFELKSTKMPHLSPFSTAKMTKMSRFYGMRDKLISM